MAVTRISRSFKDISLSFVPHPVTNDLKVLKNTDAIRRSIRNIVQTIPTERFFNPLLGSEVRSSLFDFVDYGTAAIIQDQIEETVENWEPRVNNLIVQVDPNPDNFDALPLIKSSLKFFKYLSNIGLFKTCSISISFFESTQTSFLAIDVSSIAFINVIISESN